MNSLSSKTVQHISKCIYVNVLPTIYSCFVSMHLNNVVNLINSVYIADVSCKSQGMSAD